MRLLQSRRGRFIAFFVLLAGTLGIGYPLDHRNEELRASYGKAFPDLQKAADATVAKSILEIWNGKEGANDAIRTAIYIDLAFALFYSALGALLAYLATLRRPTPWVARLGWWAAVAALAGGAADLIENGFMLAMLGDPGAASLFPAMHVFTVIKGLGLVVGSCYVILSHLDS